MERGNSSNGGSQVCVTATGTVIVGRFAFCGQSRYWRNDVPMDSVTQYRVRIVQSVSRSNRVSRSPWQSLHARTLSMIQAARPAGESARAAAIVSGRVPMIQL